MLLPEASTRTGKAGARWRKLLSCKAEPWKGLTYGWIGLRVAVVPVCTSTSCVNVSVCIGGCLVKLADLRRTLSFWCGIDPHTRICIHAHASCCILKKGVVTMPEGVPADGIYTANRAQNVVVGRQRNEMPRDHRVTKLFPT